jgi:hypothetical protein
MVLDNVPSDNVPSDKIFWLSFPPLTCPSNLDTIHLKP